MKNWNIILAALGGVLAGTTIGLLFAPNKGCVTRAKIKKCLKDRGIILSKENLEKLTTEIEHEIDKNTN